MVGFLRGLLTNLGTRYATSILRRSQFAPVNYGDITIAGHVVQLAAELLGVPVLRES